MQPAITPTMTAQNPHLDIQGNPSTAKSSIRLLNDRSNGAPLKVLSEYDWNFWQHDGFVVTRSTVPEEQVQRLAKFLWEFEEKDPGEPATWYTPPRAEMQKKELTNTGMVEVYNHQYLWDNRQTPKARGGIVPAGQKTTGAGQMVLLTMPINSLL